MQSWSAFNRELAGGTLRAVEAFEVGGQKNAPWIRFARTGFVRAQTASVSVVVVVVVMVVVVMVVVVVVMVAVVVVMMMLMMLMRMPMPMLMMVMVMVMAMPLAMTMWRRGGPLLCLAVGATLARG